MDKNPPINETDSAPPVAANPIFFIDYDGTLASIVERPMEAEPYPGVPELLKRLNDQYPVWLVTGRHLEDLAVLLPDISVRAIGLHGAQEGRIGAKAASFIEPAARKAMDRLRSEVPDIEGIFVESKGPTFAVHYRQVRDEEKARAALKKWADSSSTSLDILWGKKVVEVRAKGTHKGVAVQRICADFPDHMPVYLGDDETDEDAFRALHALRDTAVTIRVGGGQTIARHALEGPPQVVAYLQSYLRNVGE